MSRILCSWLGSRDLKSIEENYPLACPLLQIALEVKPEVIELLWCESRKSKLSLDNKEIVHAWLKKQLGSVGIGLEIKITGLLEKSDKVMDFEWVYAQVDGVLSKMQKEDVLFANATSGTSIMTAAWIVRSRAILTPPLQLFLSSKEQGVTSLHLPKKLWIDVDSVLGVKSENSLIRQYFHGSLWKGAPLFDNFFGESEVITAVKERAFCGAQFEDVPILILGDPGTGKSLLAREIHQISGRNGEFVEVDCGQLSGATEWHSIFGWAKGAFTGADRNNEGLVKQADKGTIFLDEIGNLRPEQQAMLLRFVQTKKYRSLGDKEEKHANVRIVAATNAALYDLVRQKQFRQDLYDRIRCISIQLPALKDRREDIMPLAIRKLEEFQTRHISSMETAGIPQRCLDPDVENVLRRYDWPGNIRELEFLVARLVIFSDRAKSVIDADEIRKELDLSDGLVNGGILDQDFGSDFNLEEITLQFQRHYVQRAACIAKGNKSKMARLLGFGSSRTPLITLLHKLDITELKS